MGCGDLEERHVRYFFQCLAATTLVIGLAAPVFAAGMDAAKMTCKDFDAMDSKGMMDATMAVKKGAMDDKMADPMKAKMSDEDTMKMIAASCKGKPDMMVMDAMHK
jgi:hypothetical protein